MDKEHILLMIRGAIVVSVTIIVGYVVLLAFIATRTAPLDTFQQHIFDTANGALVGAISAGVVGFWLGSSSGSLMKNFLLKPPSEQGEIKG